MSNEIWQLETAIFPGASYNNYSSRLIFIICYQVCLKLNKIMLDFLLTIQKLKAAMEPRCYVGKISIKTRLWNLASQTE